MTFKKEGKYVGEVQDLGSGYQAYDFGRILRRASYPAIFQREHQKNRVYQDELNYFNSGYWHRPEIVTKLNDYDIEILNRSGK